MCLYKEQQAIVTRKINIICTAKTSPKHVGAVVNCMFFVLSRHVIKEESPNLCITLDYNHNSNIAPNHI